MSHPIFMQWKNNDTSNTFTYSNAEAREGTTPKASTNPMAPNGSSTVSADQKGNLSAGPVGSYEWLSATDTNKKVAVSYTHPAGTGQTSVTVSCTGYQVSTDNDAWYQSHTFTDKSLQHHDANITFYLKKA